MDFIITFFKHYNIPCLLILFFGVLFFAWIFKRRRNKAFSKSVRAAFISAAIISCIGFLLSGINSKHAGYGYCIGRFKILASEDNILWGMDEFTNKDNNSKVYRIQGIDLDNGRKLFRKLIDHHFEYIGYKKNLMWAYTEEGGNYVIGMDPTTGKERVRTDEYNLMKRVPEFAKAIYKSSSASHSPLATIAAKGGLRINDDQTTTYKDASYSVEEVHGLNEFELTASRFKNTNGNVMTFSKGEQQSLLDAKGIILNNELPFYSGMFLLFDRREEKLVTLSYKTNEHKEFVIRYLSTDGKLVWKVNQNELQVGDFFNSTPEFEKVFIYREQLIFVFEGFVFSLDSFNGQLNWLTRM